MSSKTALARVYDLFFDKELANEDLINSLCILGKRYENKSSDNSEETQWPAEFMEDVFTRIWFTYRTGFFPITKAVDGPSPSLSSLFRANFSDISLRTNEFTSDVGWGCMIRTSQSLLANTLMNLAVGRDFVYGKHDDQDKLHDEIIELFYDDPENIFSIHNFVDVGMKHCNKKPGEWFGPNAASLSIKHLSSALQSTKLAVIISETGDLFQNEIIVEKFEPTLVLLAIRLGIDNINPIYYESLVQLLSLKQSVGIAGGRPSSSHYFFGYQDQFLFYLDPHHPQRCYQKDREEEQNIFETYHTNKIRKLNIDQMDPSMLIGFLIKNEEDYDEFKSALQQNKVVHFHTSRAELSANDRRPSEFEYLRSSSISELDHNESFLEVDAEDDDFVDVGLEFDQAVANEQKELVEEKGDESSITATKNEEMEESDISDSNRFTEVEAVYEEPVMVEDMIISNEEICSVHAVNSQDTQEEENKI